MNSQTKNRGTDSGSSSHYVASVNLSEEAKEATKRVIEKLKKRKQSEPIEINPKTNIVGQQSI